MGGFEGGLDLSILVPVYKNAETVHELCQRISKALDRTTAFFEIIFVEDACPSGSLAALVDLAHRDARVAVISLAKNVGQHQAVLIGLRYARGAAVVVLDADLQDPPEAIPLLLETIADGYDAVFAGRRGAYESIPRLATSRLFKFLLHLLTGVPLDAGMFVAFNQGVTDYLLQLRASHPFVVAIIGRSSLKLTSVPVPRSRRGRGRSAYNVWQRLRVALHALRWAAADRLGLGQTAGPELSDLVRAEIGQRFESPAEA